MLQPCLLIRAVPTLYFQRAEHATDHLQDEFEFDCGSELISPHAPRHWRERHALQGVGAFHSLQVRFTCTRMVDVQQ